LTNPAPARTERMVASTICSGVNKQVSKITFTMA
jgi:hypothetical protein